MNTHLRFVGFANLRRYIDLQHQAALPGHRGLRAAFAADAFFLAVFFVVGLVDLCTRFSVADFFTAVLRSVFVSWSS